MARIFHRQDQPHPWCVRTRDPSGLASPQWWRKSGRRSRLRSLRRSIGRHGRWRRRRLTSFFLSSDPGHFICPKASNLPFRFGRWRVRDDVCGRGENGPWTGRCSALGNYRFLLVDWLQACNAMDPKWIVICKFISIMVSALCWLLQRINELRTGNWLLSFEINAKGFSC